MTENPFMRCACGKIHLRTGVRHESVCACGLPLYPRVHGKSISGAVVARHGKKR